MSRLERAREQIQKAEWEQALSTLLVEWRESRSPRVADLIDRIGARVDAARGPIKGKSVKARTEAWLAIAKGKDPCDLGRLLATPWPGTWKPALPVLEALLEFPDDPRMAKAFAQIVDETRYDTWTASNFYRPLFARLDKLRDVRNLPLLEAQLAREKSYYYRRAMRPLEERAVEVLRKAAAELPIVDEEAALASIEALFSDETRGDASKKRGEAEFLADIYASPDDDDLRQVFADWLSERGDPRGEFIVLQLARAAGRSDDKMQRRESALLKKHGDEWAGPLHHFVSKKERVFRRGFLAEGTLEIEGRPDVPPPALSDPAWATMEAIRLTGSPELRTAIVQLPSMRFVRAWGFLPEQAAAAFARSGPHPRIVELEIEPQHEEVDAEGRKLIARGDAFPHLVRLGVAAYNFERQLWILTSALAKRVEALTVFHYDFPLGTVARLAEEHGHAARELAVCKRAHEDGWKIVLCRDDAGRFTRLRCDIVGPSSLPSSYDLVECLESIEPERLTEIVIPKPRSMTWRHDEIARVDETFARFTRLKRVEVPWERPEGEAETASLQISLYGSLETKERLPAVWKILNAPPFSLALDGFEVNHAKATKFRGDPLAEIAAALKKPRISAIRAYRSAASDHAAFMFYPEGTWATITVPLRVADAIPEALIAILDELAVDHGHAGFLKIGPNDHYSYAVHELDPPLPDGDLGWLSIFSETPYFSLDSLESVLRAHGLRTLRSKRNLVAVAPDPHTPMSEETVHAIRLALCPILWRSHAKLRGFVLPDLTDELVKPALEKHGFREVELPPLKRALGERFFVSAHETGARGIYIEPRFPARDGKLDIELRHTRNAPDADLLAGHERSTSVGDKTLHYSEHMPADSEKAARASLTSFLSRLDGDIRRWFEEPPKTKKRR